jgi:hypothetical protein
MHSLEQELRELRSEAALDEAVAGDYLDLEGRTLFSVHDELRAALYVAIALIVSGVGMLVKQHLDRIGPLALILALALAAAACYTPAVRARLKRVERSTAADYLLLLGALLVSADLGVAESQFHWLGMNWSRQLLLLTAAHGFAAYALESRLVLSVALTSLATWCGVERDGWSAWGWESGSLAVGLRALTCAALMFAWRAVDRRRHTTQFQSTFENFAANIAFWGVLAWCSNPEFRVLGIVSLIALAVLSIRKALASGEEAFAVYGAGYTALGLCLVVGQITNLSVLGAALVLAIVVTTAAVLRYFHDLLKDVSP